MKREAVMALLIGEFTNQLSRKQFRRDQLHYFTEFANDHPDLFLSDDILEFFRTFVVHVGFPGECFTALVDCVGFDRIYCPARVIWEFLVHFREHSNVDLQSQVDLAFEYLRKHKPMDYQSAMANFKLAIDSLAGTQTFGGYIRQNAANPKA